MLWKFLYSLNEKILVLKYSGGMLQDTEQECFDNVMILHKYMEDILPILEIETTIWSSLLAGQLHVKTNISWIQKYLTAFILWMHKMD